MQRIISVLTFVAFPMMAAVAAVPNMTCKGSISVGGLAASTEAPQSIAVSDVFRVLAGRLFHSWRGRDEYLYNDISEVSPGRYAAGHMLFVMSQDGGRKGYVVIAAPTDWRVVYIDCVG